MYTVEKRTVRKSGELINAWNRYSYSSHGKIKQEGVWCVMSGKAVYAEARGKAKAENIADALNALEDI